MMFAIGIVLFALAILFSVALHECGHMWVGRATGMKVRRYFVGFGPTLWSTRRGETEYGLKAVPAGGFCDIAGMTSVDELEPDERDRAMYKQKTWKRAAVLLAGPGMNFVIGVLLIYAIALVGGLPNLHPQSAAYVGQTTCVQNEVTKGQLDKCTGPGPAAQAGIKPGDQIVQVGATPVHSPEELVAAVRKLTGPTPFVVKRTEHGTSTEITTVVDVAQTKRFLSDDAKAPSTVGAVGVSASEYGPAEIRHYNPVTAIPGTAAFTGDLGVLLGKSLVKIPTKIGALVHSLTGSKRDPETPISVVGASIIGGDLVNLRSWSGFWLMLAQLNFVLGIVNLIPLLPFDGGHIAIAVFEKIRNTIRSARGMVAAAPVNYLRLMPATYVVFAVLAGFMLLTVTADFINPIRLN